MIAASGKICFNEPTSPSAQRICNILLQEHIFSSTTHKVDQWPEEERGGVIHLPVFTFICLFPSAWASSPSAASVKLIVAGGCGHQSKRGLGVIDTCHIVIILRARKLQSTSTTNVPASSTICFQFHNLKSDFFHKAHVLIIWNWLPPQGWLFKSREH